MIAQFHPPWFHKRRNQWLIAVTIAFSLSTLVPDGGQWLQTLRGLELWFWPLFLMLQWSCALLMLPSLPLVLLAALVFPHQGGLVLVMALLGVAGSAALIYRWADFLGLAAWFEQDPRARPCKDWIQRYGSSALALWAATPFLPTDLGCYLAASAKMRFWPYLLASILGESLLCASVIWGAQMALRAG